MRATWRTWGIGVCRLRRRRWLDLTELDEPMPELLTAAGCVLEMLDRIGKLLLTRRGPLRCVRRDIAVTTVRDLSTSPLTSSVFESKAWPSARRPAGTEDTRFRPNRLVRKQRWNRLAGAACRRRDHPERPHRRRFCRQQDGSFVREYRHQRRRSLWGVVVFGFYAAASALPAQTFMTQHNFDGVDGIGLGGG
jgi:hypothetical protein